MPIPIFDNEDLTILTYCEYLVYFGLIGLICGISMIVNDVDSHYFHFGPSTGVTYCGVLLDTWTKYSITMTFVVITQTSRRLIQEYVDPQLRNVISNPNVIIVQGIAKTKFRKMLRVFRFYMNIIHIVHILAVLARFDFAIVSFLSAECLSIFLDRTRFNNIQFDADFEYSQVNNV